jgi:phytoene dehydrogenase-like protein
MEDGHFDAIAIGSGIGALTAAAILARLARRRVLVLERHSVLGGFTHQFRRQRGRTWDVGVHYVGDLHEGSTGRAVFDYVSDGGIRWSRMPEPFERFVYPDFSFDVYGDEARYRADLVRRFPQERASIARYFRDLKRAAAWGLRHFTAGLLPAPIGPALRWMTSFSSALPLSITRDHLDRHFRDPRLKALLVSQWRDHGLPPDRSAFLSHGDRGCRRRVPGSSRREARARRERARNRRRGRAPEGRP